MTGVDIALGDDSVSRQHLEVTFTDSGRFFCVDRNSTGGSYVWRNGEWQEITQGYIELDENVLLGKKKLLFSDLIAMLKKNKNVEASRVEFEPLSIKPRRNAETGEIE